MSADLPLHHLEVVEPRRSDSEGGAIIGEHIRTSPVVISDFCLTDYKPIYDDIATLVEGMALLDRRAVRHHSSGWARRLVLELPVFELSVFQSSSVMRLLGEAAWFLTGDHWEFCFVQRRGAAPDRPAYLPMPLETVRHVIPFSDGLDSFAQAQLSVHKHGNQAVLLVRSGLNGDTAFSGIAAVRVRRQFRGMRLREASYRTRPLVFYSIAAIAAAIVSAEAIVIGENGQGIFGPACLPFGDEWWFRSSHPAFVTRWEKLLQILLDVPISFEQPQLWRTKGEVISELGEKALLPGWERTRSCSSRPVQCHGRRACGVCGGCLLRTVSVHAAKLEGPVGYYAYDPRTVDDRVADQNANGTIMGRSERAAAAAAISNMSEFGQLPDTPHGTAVLKREASLAGQSDPEAAEQNLLSLAQRHRLEWDEFVNSVPKEGWFRQIVEQL
jgi:7-cyano-7-deazaguanine synthase in queuosine biosynthesis